MKRGVPVVLAGLLAISLLGNGFLWMAWKEGGRQLDLVAERIFLLASGYMESVSRLLKLAASKEPQSGDRDAGLLVTDQYLAFQVGLSRVLASTGRLSPQEQEAMGSLNQALLGCLSSARATDDAGELIRLSEISGALARAYMSASETPGRDLKALVVKALESVQALDLLSSEQERDGPICSKENATESEPDKEGTAPEKSPALNLPDLRSGDEIGMGFTIQHIECGPNHASFILSGEAEVAGFLNYSPYHERIIFTITGDVFPTITMFGDFQFTPGSVTVRNEDAFLKAVALAGYDLEKIRDGGDELPIRMRIRDLEFGGEWRSEYGASVEFLAIIEAGS